MYTPDLAGLRQHLVASGVSVSEIKRPPYMPSGTVNLTDPDGYHIEIAHWGRPEHEQWEAKLAARAAK